MLQDPAIRNPIAISLGAIAGALSRYYLTVWFFQRFGTGFPYGTFFINLTGCFAMGFFTTLALNRVGVISPEVRLLVATGFLGAYTTFSTYGIETLYLLRDRAFAMYFWAQALATLGTLALPFYVLFVGNLSDRIAGGAPFATPWAKDTQLRTRDIEAMQLRLTALGFYKDKVDGKAGMLTRAALGAYQKKNGLKVDCWPTPAVLGHMRR